MVKGWNGPYLKEWPSMTVWGGTYEFRNDNAQDWNGDGTGDIARYVELPLAHQIEAERIDRKLDGIVSGTTGSVRYATSDRVTIRILISTDAEVK
jgi:hypothetical protein